MAPQSFVLGVWLAGLSLQVLLATVLVVKKMWAKFPMFTAYVLYTLGETGALFAVYRKPSVYFFAYAAGESVSVILGLALVYEVFTHLFSSLSALRRLAWLSFRAAVVLLVLLAGALIYSRTPTGMEGLGAALLLVEEAARILEVGLITFIFGFSSVFGLHWRQSVFGITLGFGIPAITELVAVTIAPHVGPAMRQALNLAHLVTFDFGVLIWLSYALMPEPVTSVAELPKPAQLEQWNQAIMELINQ
jgi:hypothetical protein